MLTMVLQMSGATVLYIAATAILWHFWHKGTSHTMLQKAAVGLFYGLCSIISNHVGIDYGNMVLNVRDIGPLAAGLFFSPASGIISGLIGGIERFIIGEYFSIGRFTRVACSLSTILAGLLAAGMSRWFYQERRPSFFNCLLIGAEMEVFHMYAVFLTHRDDIITAQNAVSVCALPMILFTGIGLAACSLVIAWMSGAARMHRARIRKRDLPLGIRFQVMLGVVIVSLFTTSTLLNHSVQTNIAVTSEGNKLQADAFNCVAKYEKTGDFEQLKEELKFKNSETAYLYRLVDSEKNLQYTMTPGEEEGIPIDSRDAAAILEHAGHFPFRAYFPPFSERLEYLCYSIHLDGPYYLIGGIACQFVFRSMESPMQETLFLEILVFTALYLLIGSLVNRLVVRNLERINKSLARITDGDLNEVVAVEESVEFTQLSTDINKTVTALRDLIGAAEKRMEEELQLAAEIQAAALPQNFRLPDDRIELYALMTPAKQVGGDFYDFFFISPRQLALVIADVSGKGIPAAMFMMRAKTAIKNFSDEGKSPAEILSDVNNALCDGNDTQMFVTVWLGILDLETGRMRCANAGHEYPVQLRAGGSYSLLKDQHGFVLGGFDGISVPGYEIRMSPGDRLFVYTDGIPEARNTGGEQYGTDRLEACLNRVKGEAQQLVLDGVLADVREFASGTEQFDDITMLGITYHGNGLRS